MIGCLLWVVRCFPRCPGFCDPPHSENISKQARRLKKWFIKSSPALTGLRKRDVLFTRIIELQVEFVSGQHIGLPFREGQGFSLTGTWPEIGSTAASRIYGARSQMFSREACQSPKKLGSVACQLGQLVGSPPS